MAVLAGHAGSFRLSTNVVAELDAWTLEVSTDTEETQAFGDTWKEHTATVKEWSGTASGRLDISDTNGHVALQTAVLGGTTVSGRFYVNGTNYYAGTAFVQASISAPENGVITVSYSLQGTGSLSYS